MCFSNNPIIVIMTIMTIQMKIMIIIAGSGDMATVSQGSHGQTACEPATGGEWQLYNYEVSSEWIYICCSNLILFNLLPHSFLRLRKSSAGWYILNIVFFWDINPQCLVQTAPDSQQSDLCCGFAPSSLPTAKHQLPWGGTQQKKASLQIRTGA